jgi:hypothetical protein
MYRYSHTGSKKLGDGNRPGGYSLTYIAPPAPKKAPEVRIAPVAEPGGDPEKLAAAIQKLKIATVKDLVGKDAFHDMHAQVADEYPANLELATAKLHHLDAAVDDDTRAAVVEQADAVIALIDADKLATALGRQADTDDAAKVKSREAETSKRDVLVDALNRKALACTNLGQLDTVDAVAREIRQWDKMESNEKLLKLNLAIHASKGHWGKIVKVADKQFLKADSATRKVLLDTQRNAFEQLGWGHIAEYERKWEMIRSPPSGTPAY